jgi:nicotinate phosphoribosyltransferase
MLDYARTLRFDGDVDALPEGSIVFVEEPILRVTAPWPMARLVECRLLSLIHFETVVASRAARLVRAAQGRPLLDFDLRSAHGSEAGMLAARAAYLAGFDGTATVDAARRFGIPAFSTLSLESGATDLASLVSLVSALPERSALLADAGDAAHEARTLVDSAQALTRAGFALAGVQIDGLDLANRARAVRALLDEAGLARMSICAGVDLEDTAIEALAADAAPIDEFGLRGWLSNEGDATRIDACYVERPFPSSDSARPDIVDRARHVLRGLGAEEHDPLLRPCMRNGQRVGVPQTLHAAREYHARQIACMSESLRALERAPLPKSGTGLR